jgi:hypothetical protein
VVQMGHDELPELGVLLEELAGDGLLELELFFLGCDPLLFLEFEGFLLGFLGMSEYVTSSTNPAFWRLFLE